MITSETLTDSINDLEGYIISITGAGRRLQARGQAPVRPRLPGDP